MSAGATVLDLVSRGDPGAEEALLDRYGGLIWSLARRYCADRAEAEDAVQEIILDVWKSARQGRFDGSKGSDSTFVAMIARRRLIDRLRRRKGPVALPDDAVLIAPGAKAFEAGGEEAAAAAAALSELSEAQQTAIRLAVLHGLTHEEVAEATGMPLGTVKTHIRRGLIRLREVVLGRLGTGEGVVR